ncbi:MAG TPA: D-aminoacyl-tRNA deacylase [Burkholderiales bacterium]|nr:D-aminoacyl-tRNA deacylase [Burkholderiales bacterium]
MQRVAEARVAVEGEELGRIGRGVLALVGIERGDREREAQRLAERVLGYRMFPDEAGRMNRSLAELEGGLLVVPQFTLAADTASGTRAGFSRAAEPLEGKRLYEAFVAACRVRHREVATGRFGADMQVGLVNDGPVTFWLQVGAPG